MKAAERIKALELDLGLMRIDRDNEKRLRESCEAALAKAQTENAPGLSLEQEPKYTTDGRHIINRATGEPIPSDEPIFIFRARDTYAGGLIGLYLRMLVRGVHSAAVFERCRQFAEFRARHPARMKYPDTDPPKRTIEG